MVGGHPETIDFPVCPPGLFHDLCLMGKTALSNFQDDLYQFSGTNGASSLLHHVKSDSGALALFRADRYAAPLFFENSLGKGQSHSYMLGFI